MARARDDAVRTAPVLALLSVLLAAVDIAPLVLAALPDYNMVILSEQDMAECLDKQQTLVHSHAMGAQITVRYGENGSSAESVSCLVNLTAPEGDVFRVVVRSVETQPPCGTLPVKSKLSVLEGDSAVISLCGYPNTTFSSNRTLAVHVEVHDGAPFAMSMLIITVSADHRLHVNFTSAKEGYVSSPGWVPGITYPRHLDLSDRLALPAQHAVMVSFLHLRLQHDDSLTLHSGGLRDPTTLLWMATGTHQPPPAIYNASYLHFRFRTGAAFNYVNITYGFQLMVTFHPLGEEPQQVDNELWNCSDASWAAMSPHLSCNMLLECQGEEDEASCPYNGACGAGRVAVGESCYLVPLYRPANTSTSWLEARKACAGRGGDLASLNTPALWHGALRAMDTGRPSAVFIGLHLPTLGMPNMYRSVWRWTDGSSAFYLAGVQVNGRRYCSLYDRQRWPTNRAVFCHEPQHEVHELCQAARDTPPPGSVNLSLAEGVAQRWMDGAPGRFKFCPQGHFTLAFLKYELHCFGWSSNPTYYKCTQTEQLVPYTLVCDHNPDCGDISDEWFCVFPLCEEQGLSRYRCRNGQCIPIQQRCDKIDDCFDQSDEEGCVVTVYSTIYTHAPPALVDMNQFGRLIVKPMDQSTLHTGVFSRACPETHFDCVHTESYYCLPVYLRCNRYRDCPQGEDEDCEGAACPGLYRCRRSLVCLHPDHLCDGRRQCPHGDDELLCDLRCPDTCRCLGLEFVCQTNFNASRFPDLRFLSADGSGIRFEDLRGNLLLLHLDLAHNGLQSLDGANFLNLLHLDISDNAVTHLDTQLLAKMPNLRSLHVGMNPLRQLFHLPPGEIRGPRLKLQVLNASHVWLESLAGETFEVAGVMELHTLVLSFTGLRTITGSGFRRLEKLRTLRLDGCPLQSFPRDMFRGLYHLTTVTADNYKVCCPQVLPEHFQTFGVCLAPMDEISSCASLLRDNVYRFFLYVFAFLALICNIASLAFRLCRKGGERRGVGVDSSCDVLVSHLCVSDSLMGIYLVIIGVADVVYRGSYLWKDDEWRASAACKVAGFLSMLSSEVSVFLIFLITVDRLIALRKPMSPFVFTSRSAHVLSGVTWLGGLALSGLPLLTAMDFYGQTGTCLPLPITRRRFRDYDYSFGVFIVLNLAVFLLVAAGQVLIYRSLAACVALTASDSGVSKDANVRITRRLIAIAMTDFLCWFPISVLGLCAAFGLPVPGNANVAVAIFVLPINAALNPFIYTLSLMVERYREVVSEEDGEAEDGIDMSHTAAPGGPHPAPPAGTGQTTVTTAIDATDGGTTADTNGAAPMDTTASYSEVTPATEGTSAVVVGQPQISVLVTAPDDN